MANLVSWRPRYEQAIEYPYVIIANYTDKHGYEHSNGVIDSGQAENIIGEITKEKSSGLYAAFVPILKQLIGYETEKEKGYIKKLYDKLRLSEEENDRTFADELKQYLGSPSTAINMLDLYSRGLYQLKKGYTPQMNFQANRERFHEIWEKLGGKTTTAIIKNLYDEIHSNPSQWMDKSPEKLVAEIKTRIQTAWGKELSDSYDYLLEEFLKGIMGNAFITDTGDQKAVFKKAFTKWTAQEMKDTVMSGDSQATIEGYFKDGNAGEAIADKVAALAFGYANGLMGELWTIINTKQNGYFGMQLGRVKTDTKVLANSGAKISKNVQGKTDSMLLLRVKGSVYSPDIDGLFKQIEDEADAQHTDQWLPKSREQFALEDYFIVEMSVKDQYTESDSIRIAANGKFAGRLANIKELASINRSGKPTSMATSTQVNELIFSIVNSANGLISEKHISDIEKNLRTLVSVFMFDDYIDMYDQLVNNQRDNRLHIYFIDGDYYVLSDLLKVVQASLQDSAKTKPLVDVHIKVPKPSSKEGSTDAEKWHNSVKPNLAGKSRWEDLRKQVLLSGGISVHINNPENLVSLLV